MTVLSPVSTTRVHGPSSRAKARPVNSGSGNRALVCVCVCKLRLFIGDHSFSLRHVAVLSCLLVY